MEYDTWYASCIATDPAYRGPRAGLASAFLDRVLAVAAATHSVVALGTQNEKNMSVFPAPIVRSWLVECSAVGCGLFDRRLRVVVLLINGGAAQCGAGSSPKRFGCRLREITGGKACAGTTQYFTATVRVGDR
jgi:hypothetical protein